MVTSSGGCGRTGRSPKSRAWRSGNRPPSRPGSPAGDGDPETDPVGEVARLIPRRLVTRTRRQLLPDRSWYRSAHYHKYHRPNGIDDYALSLWELPGGRVDVIGLHREIGGRDFSAREWNLLHMFHAELGRLIGPVLVSADDRFSPTRLPPRVRETLACLLDGDGEKQAAARMGLSGPDRPPVRDRPVPALPGRQPGRAARPGAPADGTERVSRCQVRPLG